MRYHKSVSSRKKVSIMYRLILSSLLFFCVTSFGAKAESCSSTKYVEKQCVFDIPAIEDGGQFTATYQKFGLIGGVIAQCSSGTVSFGA